MHCENICGDCAFFHADLSKVRPDFPKRSGCVLIKYERRVPAAVPAHEKQRCLGMVAIERRTFFSAGLCGDFLPRKARDFGATHANEKARREAAGEGK